MKTLQCLAVFFITVLTTQAQAIYETIDSNILGSERKLKIQLPRNYDSNAEKEYPLILVLDGDYLYEPVAGNTDYFSYWEDMPEAIVVGVSHEDREADTYYDDVDYLPKKSGAAFMDFLGKELMPMLEKKFRLAPFKLAVGHDMTANFITFDLMRERRLFQGYIALSPDYAPFMTERLLDILPTIESPVFYYLATGSSDISGLRDEILKMDAALKNQKNENFTYFFDDFQDATHYSLAGRALPKALEDIFAIYRPISKKEYKEKVLASNEPAYDYLINKYGMVKKLFGIENRIRLNDFEAIYAAIEKKEDWEGLEKLAKLARKEYPDTMLGSYYFAFYNEQTGNPKRAVKDYLNAFSLAEVSYLTKDMMLERADRLKEDFGIRN